VNPGQIVQISEDNLPVEKIDLRTSSKRKNHYLPGNDSNELTDTSGLKSLYNMFQSSYLVKQNENDILLLIITR
jgi:hypothetical protein